MLKYEVVIFWSDEDDLFVAFSPELVGCMAHGDTREVALENIQEAMGHWLDVCRETGKPIPQLSGQRTDFWPHVPTQAANPAAA